MELTEIVHKLKEFKQDTFRDFTIIPPTEIHQKRKVSSIIKCQINIGQKDVILHVGLRDSFPYTLPIIFLEDSNIFGIIPHLEEDGYVCYLSSEGLLLDSEKPVNIIIECLQKAFKILDDGVNGRNQDDLYNEFEAYWRRLGNTKIAASLVIPNLECSFQPIYVWSVKEDKMLVMSETKEKARRYIRLAFDSNFEFEGKVDYHGYFIMLRPGTRLCLSKLMPLTPRSIRKLIHENLSGSIRRRFLKAIKRKTVQQGNKEYLLIGLPQPDGNISLVGIEFSEFRANASTKTVLRHPLERSNYDVEVTPLIIDRHYPEHLVMRTGGEQSLRNKKVILLGGGAIGSRVVGELIRAGIMEIKIIDNDMFMADNLLRHELGVFYLHYNKAEALSRHYQFKYPFAKIDYLKADVLDVLFNYPDMLDKYDLVISALGNPTIEMLINQKLHELAHSPPIIFTWVEPLGIGGHALATLNNEKTGCYACLHTNPAGPTTEYINRASFAAPRQTFSKTVSGCGTQFTPYGSLDAIHTAIIATRLAINILTGEENGNPLMSWKGNAAKFINSGFSLSDRFDLTEEQLFDTRYSYKTDRCKICYERN